MRMYGTPEKFTCVSDPKQKWGAEKQFRLTLSVIL